jgi:hypothetical protein
MKPDLEYSIELNSADCVSTFSVGRTFLYLLVSSAILTICNLVAGWGLPFLVVISPILLLPAMFVTMLVCAAVSIGLFLALLYLSETTIQFNRETPEDGTGTTDEG